MKKLLSFHIVLLFAFAILLPVYAHPGRTDSNGGHVDKSTGEYHYHHSYPAHQHTDINGDGIPDCPYSASSSVTTAPTIAIDSSRLEEFLDSVQSRSAASSTGSSSSPVKSAPAKVSVSDPKVKSSSATSSDLTMTIIVFLSFALFCSVLANLDKLSKIDDLRRQLRAHKEQSEKQLQEQQDAFNLQLSDAEAEMDAMYDDLKNQYRLSLAKYESEIHHLRKERP